MSKKKYINRYSHFFSDYNGFVVKKRGDQCIHEIRQPIGIKKNRWVVGFWSNSGTWGV